jgi:hypothetical protein
MNLYQNQEMLSDEKFIQQALQDRQLHAKAKIIVLQKIS